MKRVVASLLLSLSAACGGRLAEEVSDAASDANVSKPYLVAYAGDNLHPFVWHSRDGTLTQLATEHTFAPTFSADGRVLASTAGYSGDAVDLLSLDGGVETLPLPTTNQAGFVTPRSDGMRFLLADVSSSACVATLDRNGPFHMLPVCRAWRAFYAPDEKTIVVTRWSDEGATAHEIVTMSDDGSDLTLVVPSMPNTILSVAAFSPDGTKLVFLRQRTDGTWDLDVVDRKSRAVQTIGLIADHLASSPQLTPDARSVLFVARKGPVHTLKRFDVATGTVDVLIPVMLQSDVPQGYISVAPDNSP